MKIDRKKLTLIIASLCGTGSSLTAWAQEFSTSTPASSVGRIGDGGGAPSTIRDEDTRPTAFRSNFVVDAGPASYHSDVAANTSYASSCGSGSCGTSVCSTGCQDPSTFWFESETLLWWAKGQQGSPLVVGGNAPNVLPTTPLAGDSGNPIGNSMLVGARINAGKWLDCNQNFGVGGRVYGILTDETTNTYTNNGNSTGVPFFNTTINAPDTYLVNFADVTGSNTGTISISSDVDLIATDLYGRALLLRDGGSRVDLLGGYTFTRLDTHLGINTQYTDGITNPIQNGTVITTSDSFGTKNEFHGGHIGLLNEVSFGRFSISALGKVALGNMRSSSQISGRYTETPPNAATVTEDRGLFAQSSNIGTITTDRFSFLPEAGAKIKYQLGRAQLGVGYTLLVFPTVAVASSQVDRNVDIGGIAGTPTAPAPRLATDTYFLHGLDLGVTFKF